MPAAGSANRPGTVLAAAGGVYEVQFEDGTIADASLRGRLKLETRTGDRIVAGDAVSVTRQRDGACTIEAVAPRRTQLARRAPGRGSRRVKVIVANIDQVVIVLAVAQPAPRLRMLDRFLVLAESNHLPAVIVVNKTDLAESGAVDTLFAPYRAAGYTVLATSVSTGAGLEALRARLCDCRSVLTGPSGVGKSSLLNALEPGLALRVAAIGEAARKGRHTTVNARLIRLACTGYVADTPGLREVGLRDVDLAQLDHRFPEFRPFLGRCRFRDSCSHTHEPDCAIRDAVAAGAVDADRFASYAALLAGTG